ncbi:MAG: DegV family protein [Ruminococcus sp.]|nr:DegV family protein [Ruminococcus sp.]
MRPIKILTDSCSDMSGELLEKYDIDYARMNTVRAGKETEASLTWEYYTPKELYDIMRGGERVTTTQVPVNEFMRIFGKYLDLGFDIIYIGCSLKQSGSVNTGKVAAADILKKYPDAKITCIDSLNACIGEGILAIYASELAAEGKGYDEIVEAVNARRNNVVEYVTVHSLDALKRAGRVKASSAFFGNLMGVKPILISDADGVQTPIKKVRGRANSLEEMVSMMAENMIEPEKQYVYLAHADCSQEELDSIRGMIKAKIPCKGIVTVYIGPIIGASIGPDAIGLWAFGKEITYRVGEAK